MRRRTFIAGVSTTCLVVSTTSKLVAQSNRVERIEKVEPHQGLFDYIIRQRGKFDSELYFKLLGSANNFKEGDQIVGVAAVDDMSRTNARHLIANTRLIDIDAHPPLKDELYSFISKRTAADNSTLTSMTVGQLKDFLLSKDEVTIHAVKDDLSSDCIACVVKLMTNDELISVGAKVFNPLPNSHIGAKGYLGARVQPNSPTDDLDDIRWQVFDAFSYAVGDVLLGTNPVSSDPASVASVEQCLQDILHTFEISDAMPHCVLAHIDVQAEVEKRFPKSTELWFQSIAGNDTANATFDITVEKMIRHARARTGGKFGLYFETGQGADFTNGHAHGFDMLIHESRKYGLARQLTAVVRQARQQAGMSGDAWVHVNDVAGFIGPEVFRTKEQLVRCCLEDIVMGKLHGLTIGLDVCSTLHMDVSLDDLDWCLDQVVAACPAYLMALPTKIDPMLGYLTTGYQDHVRLRNRFGLRVNDRMWSFFQSLGIIDSEGNATEHFGDPKWVYLQYQRRKKDLRTDEAILREAVERLEDISKRGVFVAQGFGENEWTLEPNMNRDIHRIYDDAKECIWRQWDANFIAKLPNVLKLETQSENREDYILHPASGENLSQESLGKIRQLRGEITGISDCVIVVSEGLNALAAMAPDQLMPLVNGLRNGLQSAGFKVSERLLVVHSGRVRAGYRIGEELFRGIDGHQTILHIIGERPGSGHRTLSVYMTRAAGSDWSIANKVDHNITRVVSGIATTALLPEMAARECLRILKG
jgi:ethanolamine ammonia-lyase large subunit